MSDEGGGRVGERRAALDGPAPVDPGAFQEALGRLGPRGHLVSMHGAHVLDGGRDDSVPDGAGERGLGRGEGSAVDVVDAVVVAGEALDDESLEGGIVPVGLGFGGELGELRRRGPRLNAGVSLLRFGRLHGPPGGWTFRVSHGSRGASIREEPGASAPCGRTAGALRPM